MEQEKRKIAYLVIGKGMDDLKRHLLERDSYIIGIDKGAFLLAKEGLSFDEAVGDFDSTNEEELKLVKCFARKVTQLNSIKDDSDTAHAYEEYKTKANEIVIVGGVQGKRIEHFIANMTLLIKDKRVSFEDEDSRIYSISSRKAPYIFKNKNCFYSFFPLQKSVLSLKGFKYPLERRVLEKNDPLGLSNELASEEGILTLEKGRLLVIETKKEANS